MLFAFAPALRHDENDFSMPDWSFDETASIVGEPTSNLPINWIRDVQAFPGFARTCAIGLDNQSRPRCAFLPDCQPRSSIDGEAAAGGGAGQ